MKSRSLFIFVLPSLVSFFFISTVCAGEIRQGLDERFIVGYQGWFGCPGDFGDNQEWQHWFFKSVVGPDNLVVDMLPSLRDFVPTDLCDTGLKRPDGSKFYLYSAQNPHIVAVHFGWMRDHGIDGAAASRFIGPVKSQGASRFDRVLTNVRTAAEATGRVFFVDYDVSGAEPKTIIDDLRNDWRHLVDDLQVTASPNYLRDRGKPVLELWGFGFSGHPGEAAEVSALIAELKGGRDGLQAATVIGGVPTNWRTLNGDSKKDPAWAATYRSYDVISPWSVGRFRDDTGADDFMRDHVTGDLAETRRVGIRYMPVVFPGGSMKNLLTTRGDPSASSYPLNRVPRSCGNFYWHQVSNLLDQHVNMLFTAMFDEVDESTAIYPVVTRADNVPAGTQLVTLNIDGCSLPDDWYMRVAGKAATYLHMQKAPPKSLKAVMTP